MNATEFRTAIARLGMTQRGASTFFRRNRTTGIRWAKDGAPEEIELWLTFMLGVQSNMHIDDVPKWIYKMAGRELEKTRKSAKKTSP